MRNILIAAALASALASPISAAAQPPAPAYTTAETTIGDLLDNPEAKAIVSKHLPDFVSNPQADMARPMTLRAIQTYAPDQITDDALAKIDAELAKLPAKK